MSKVHILPPEIVSKIAAGEVIERPASVVKELVENSIDAGAKTIELSLKHAGKISITIKDTGTGIEPDDIEKIFLRHSTSKIKAIDDLFAIHSLGFRGEALYSIAAVADVTLRSKTKSNSNGWEIHIRGGKKLTLKPVSMNNGTEIEIKELFFNTPARKKFLKTDTAELQQILNIFTPYTLLYPEKHFSLTHNDKNILNLQEEETHLTRIQKTLNLDHKHILAAEKKFPETDTSIRFFLGDVNIHRTRKDMQFIFINNRPVQNHFINFHMNEVYKAVLPLGMRPFFIAEINMPAENIDVNIHPTKREVKIKNESSIIPVIRGLAEHTLMSLGKPKEMEIESEECPSSYMKMPIRMQGQSRLSEPVPPHRETYQQHLLFGQPSGLKNRLSHARYIGTFLHKYLFFESGKSLLVIDQHAAQERVTYETLLNQVESGHVEIQRLLAPFILSLSPQEKLMWEQSKEILERLGLETTEWKHETIALHTHPSLIKNPETAVRAALSEGNVKTFDPETIARWACRGSVMAGDKLAPQEAETLRNKLMGSLCPFTCPHGRPTVIEIKEDTFEKQFLRK